MAGPGGAPVSSKSDMEVSHMPVHVGEPDSRGRRTSPWAWVPTVNYAQGLQYMVVASLLSLVYKTMGMSDTDATLYPGWILMAWTLKPLWGPLVDRYWTRRNWTIWMQFTVGICFGVSAFAMMTPHFFQITLIAMWVVALAGATHDIACDGFYMLALNPRQQAYFVGVRSTLFRIAMVTATGALPYVAYVIQKHTGPEPVSILARTVVEGVQTKPQMELSYPGGPKEGFPQIIVEPAQFDVIPGTEVTGYVRLSAPPPDGKTMPVIIAQDGGDTELKVSSGSRTVFTAANWDQPTTFTLTAAKTVKKSVSAELQAYSGNIPLSWAIVFGVCSLTFLSLFAVHMIAIPKPAADDLTGVAKPPFFQAFGALFLTIGIVIFSSWLMWRLLGLGLPTVKGWLFHGVLTETQTKLFTIISNLGRSMIIVGVFAALIAAGVTRQILGGFFYYMSDLSGIGFADVFVSYFKKPGIFFVVGFILTFRFGEAMIGAISQLFLYSPLQKEDPITHEMIKGGLGLTLGEISFSKGVVYVIALIFGGISSGMLISKFTLKKVIWPTVLFMHAPNILYLYLADSQTSNLYVINSIIGVEAFAYGFGLTTMLLIMIYASQGPYKTAHYAICTGIMGLGAQVATMMSGWLADYIGYEKFFIVVIVLCIPGLLFIPWLPLQPKIEQGNA
ncbi:hypothetical protein BH09SUM1_BH09SUM1_21830 [soil metagenome]